MPRKDGTLLMDEVRLLKHLGCMGGTAEKDSAIYRRCQRYVPLLMERGYLNDFGSVVSATKVGLDYADAWQG